jgi:HEAT repeat protein
MNGKEKSSHWLIKAADLYRANMVWKLFGTHASGQRLIEGLSSPNENVRTLAGMFLVQSGRKAIPLLEYELENRRNMPLVLTMLGDIGTAESEGQLRRHLDDPDPEAAKAANEALRALLFKQKMDSSANMESQRSPKE